MARRRSTSFGRTRQVCIIGHNAQVLATARLFLGGGVSVAIYTSDPRIDEQLAPFPNVTVAVLSDDYDQPPTDLPDCPYFLCVDRDELARRIRAWLPQTLAVFHLATERRGRTHALGFLAMAEPSSIARRRILKRLETLRRVDRLMDIARGAQLPVILMYGDPDPDAIGSALGLATIWRAAGANPLIRYTGDIQRYQNRLLVQYLKEPIERLRDTELAGADLVAVVDAQPGFWKTNPPRPQVIIDHHPLREDSAAIYMDIRDHHGSASTILTEYLFEAGLPVKRRLATALLYGLITDTNDLQRNTHAPDIRAYDLLHGRADLHFLSRLAKSQVPMNMLDHIAWGLGHRIVYRDLMLVHFGEIENTDLLVQSADLMLLTCGINWVVCAGKFEDRLVVVFRGDGHRQDVGKRAASAFGKIGSAGGHRTMGRAEIPLAGEHVDTSAAILVNNLFRRMSDDRRRELIKLIRNHLHGAGPGSTPVFVG